MGAYTHTNLLVNEKANLIFEGVTVKSRFQTIRINIESKSTAKIRTRRTINLSYGHVKMYVLNITALLDCIITELQAYFSEIFQKNKIYISTVCLCTDIFISCYENYIGNLSVFLAGNLTRPVEYHLELKISNNFL